MSASITGPVIYLLQVFIFSRTSEWCYHLDSVFFLYRRTFSQWMIYLSHLGYVLWHFHVLANVFLHSKFRSTRLGSPYARAVPLHLTTVIAGYATPLDRNCGVRVHPQKNAYSMGCGGWQHLSFIEDRGSLIIYLPKGRGRECRLSVGRRWEYLVDFFGFCSFYSVKVWFLLYICSYQVSFCIECPESW